MSDGARFPLLLDNRNLLHRGLPASVPWSLVAGHERQAMRNHGGQTLAVLASRGGLSPAELFDVVHDRDYDWGRGTDAVAVAWLREQVTT